MEKNCFITGVCEKYDERLLENRMQIEGNMVSLLLQDLTNYDDFKSTEKDFLTKDGRFLYSLGKTLRDAGYSYLDEVTVMSQCSTEVKDKIAVIGGYRVIQHLIDIVNPKNLDAYLDDFIKSNFILKLYSSGFNLFSEVEFDIKDKKGNPKKATPFDFFNKCCNSTEVIDWYEAKLSAFSTVSNNKITGEELITFDDTFFNNLSTGYEMGISYADCGLDIEGNKISTFPFLSNTTMGYGEGLHAVTGFSGVGKTVMLSEMILSLISQGKKCIFIENEMTINSIKIVLFEFLLDRYAKYHNLTKKKLISGNFNEEDKLMIKKVSDYWNENFSKNLKIITLADADASLTEQLIKKSILREGYDVFCVDTFKLDTSSNSKSSDNFWMNLVDDSKKLHAIALKYHVCGIISIQLALANANRLWLDKSCLSTAKGVCEILDTIIGLRPVVTEELLPGSPIYCKPFRSKQLPNGEWIEEEYTADQTKVWRMLFIIKNRKGVCSDDNGVTWLLRYDGDHCSLYETSKARSSRKTINSGDTK